MDTVRVKEMKKMSPKTKRAIKKHLFVYGMLSVPIIHFLVFFVYVNFDSFFIAFKDLHTGAFTFNNFTYFFNDLKLGADSPILQTLTNTLIYFFTGILCNAISFVFAYFIYKKILFYKFYRLMFVVPMIVSGAALAMIYMNFLSVDGPLEAIYKAFSGGKNLPGLLYHEKYATWTIVAFVIWTGLGMNLIMFSGAMNRIPVSVTEYARIDGVNTFREMFQIVLPIVAPTFGTVMFLSCINVFGATGPILLFTNGRFKTSTISFWMYQNIVETSQSGAESQYNLASAYGLMLSLASVPIVIFMRWLINRTSKNEIAF